MTPPWGWPRTNAMHHLAKQVLRVLLILGTGMGCKQSQTPTVHNPRRETQPTIVVEPPDEFVDPIRFVADPIDLLNIGSFARDVALRQAQLPKEPGAVDCRPVSNSNVPGTFLCLSKSIEAQNRLFTRASNYSEGSRFTTAGYLIPFDHMGYVDYVEHIWGHDIPSDRLIPFFAEAEEEDDYEQHETCGMNPSEREFGKNVLGALIQFSKGKPFVVITAFSDLRPEDLLGVVSHEAIHAQYFLSEPIRQAVEAFWDHELSDEERTSALSDLGDFYDIDNRFVVLNEFLAYMAAYGPARSVGIAAARKSEFIAYVERRSGIPLFRYPER